MWGGGKGKEDTGRKLWEEKEEINVKLKEREGAREGMKKRKRSPMKTGGEERRVTKEGRKEGE